MTFEKGQSGNPEGRKKGSKNRATIVRDKLLKILEERSGEARKMKFDNLLNALGKTLPRETTHRFDADDVINIKISEAKANEEEDKRP